MKSIIIVEDHPIMQTGLVSYFSDTGRWQVIGTASSLSGARELFTNNTADVALLDIQLDDGWGLDIVPWIQEQQQQQQQIPLMAVYSAFDDYAHVSAALDLGAKAYITKRRNEQELEAALLKVLKGNTYIDEAAQVKLKNVTELFSLLTKREKEILTLVKNGLSNNQIAGDLGINRRTVENILSCVYNKTGIKSRLELERL
jgi:DNA-binding NarL/FixJ family response regulator